MSKHIHGGCCVPYYVDIETYSAKDLNILSQKTTTGFAGITLVVNITYRLMVQRKSALAPKETANLPINLTDRQYLGELFDTLHIAKKLSSSPDGRGISNLN
jgi:hypothetical protein